MIQDMSLWQGGYPESYEDEVLEWIKSRAGDEEVLRVHLEDLGLNPKSGNLSPYWDQLGLTDEGILFNSEKFLVVYGFETLLPVSGVNHPLAQQFVDRLKELETELTVAVIQKGFKPSASISQALKEAKGEEFDRGIPQDTPERVEWLIDWLYTRDVGISEKLAKHIVEIVPGVAPQALVELLLSLAEVCKGRAVKMADVRAQTWQFGEATIWEIIDAVLGGDAEKALETLRKSQDEPIMMLGAISGKYRNFALLSGGKNDVPALINFLVLKDEETGYPLFKGKFTKPNLKGGIDTLEIDPKRFDDDSEIYRMTISRRAVSGKGAITVTTWKRLLIQEGKRGFQKDEEDNFITELNRVSEYSWGELDGKKGYVTDMLDKEGEPIVIESLSPRSGPIAMEMKIYNLNALHFAMRDLKLTPKQLIKSFALIQRTEKGLKGGSRMEPQAQLEHLVIQLAAMMPRAA